MMMRDSEIKEAIRVAHLRIEPFDQQKLQGASYDLAIGGEALVSNRDKKVLLRPGGAESLHLNAGDFALVLTKEKVKFPLNISGVIGMRSTLARKGLLLLAGMQVDPGFEGHLRFGLYNAAPRTITLDYDDGLCMLEFHKLAGDVERVLPPEPDLIQGRIPERDKDFLRSLETTSLSDLSRNVRALTQSVSMLSKFMRWFIIPVLTAIFAGVAVSFITLIYRLR
jgi:dCTP deaminase